MVVDNDRQSLETVPCLLDVTSGARNHHEIRSSNIHCDLCNLVQDFAREKE